MAKKDRNDKSKYQLINGDDDNNTINVSLADGYDFSYWYQVNAGNGDDTVYGGEGNDRIKGGEGDDFLDGGAGADEIKGGVGNDTVIGGLGDDFMDGGDGDWDVAKYKDGLFNYVLTFSIVGDASSLTAVVDIRNHDHDELVNFEQLEFHDYVLYLDGRNNNPYAINDSDTVNEDAGLAVINVLVNDLEFDGDSLSIDSLDTTGSMGAFTLSDGKIQYGPNGAFEYLAVGEEATDSVQYTVTDSNGGFSTGTLDVTITGVNDAPEVTTPLTVTTNEDAANFSIDLLSGASDPDLSDTLSVSNLSLTSGDVSGISIYGNQLLVDPSAYDSLIGGDSREIIYSYDIVDGKGGSVAQTATMTIQGRDDFSGVVGVDGYIVGATVFSDHNNNGVLDITDEASGRTDGLGGITLMNASATGSLVLRGGVDISTGLAFEGTLLAPAGCSSITALSTLVAILMDSSSTQETAIAKVQMSFGIDAGTDILNIDPVAGTLSGSTDAATMMAMASQVLNSVLQIASLLEGAAGVDPEVEASLSSAIDTVFAQMAANLPAGTIYDLTDSAVIDDLIGDAAGVLGVVVSNELTAGSATVVSEANLQTQTALQTALPMLESGTSGEALLTDIAQISIVTQSEVATALANAAESGTTAAIDQVVNVFTGTSLTDAIGQTVVGDINGLEPDTPVSFVTTWTSMSQDGNGYEIFAQRFDTAGNALWVNDLKINTLVVGDQYDSDVTTLSDGKILITCYRSF